MKIKKLLSPVNIAVTLIFILAIAPIVYYGKNSIFTIHDSLDHILPWTKMLKDNGLLLALDAPTNQFGNMSTAYSVNNYYNLLLVPYLFFDVFTAHVIGWVLKVLTGFISMLILLKYLFPGKENDIIVKLAAVSFSLLPVSPHWWLSMDSIPLFCYAFLLIMKWKPDKIDKRVFLTFLLPFLSLFHIAGYFIMALWALGIVILWIIKKKININLIISFLCLTVGYIIVDLRLFYARFVIAEPLNRSVYGIRASVNNSVRDALSSLSADYIFSGQYHAPILGSRFIAPVVLLTLISVILFFLFKIKENKLKSGYEHLAKNSLWSIALLGLTVIFSLVRIAYSTSFFTRMIQNYLPFLDGFNWSRIFTLNRVIVYVLFTLTLITLLKIIRSRKIRFIVYVIACLQIIAVMTNTDYYNYTGLNLRHNEMVQKDGMLTYREFYAEDFFQDIKKDIGYQGEGVAALGFHPSVLMFNGFSCVDGVNNSYPLERMLAFREVIAPQLEFNPEHQNFYDRQGSRMYLYNNDISYHPTRTRAEKPAVLYINTEAFKNLGGTYILSRAEISNAADLYLSFVNYYNNENTVYEIYVYRAD